MTLKCWQQPYKSHNNNKYFVRLLVGGRGIIFARKKQKNSKEAMIIEPIHGQPRVNMFLPRKYSKKTERLACTGFYSHGVTLHV